MKALVILAVGPMLALASCVDPQNDVPREARHEVVEFAAGEPPLTLQPQKVQVVRSEFSGPDALEINLPVKFTNKSSQPIALLKHLNSIQLHVQGESGKAVSSLIQVKMPVPVPMNVVLLQPGEDVTLIFGTRPLEKVALGNHFKIRLTASPWTFEGMTPKPYHLSKKNLWPQKTVETAWQDGSTADVESVVKLGGDPSVEFISMTSLPSKSTHQNGTAFQAKYRITNNSPKTIVHIARPDALNFSVTGTRGAYLDPYAAFDMMALTVWDAVALAPGENRTCIRTTPPYQSADMENSVKVSFSLSPWDPKSIEGLKSSGLPDYMTAFPTKNVASPEFTVKRQD